MTTEAIEAVASESEANEAGDEFVASLRTAIEGLRESANVERVYGEPIVTEGRTIVPVARVAYAFGGGFGSSPETDEDAGESGGEGGDGGGGTTTQPVGVLEITDHGT